VNEMYTGTQDNGGVHINSGIINFAFYKYAVATGIDKAELTFFRALFQYLTRSSQFIDCRLAVVQSAKDLYGDGSSEVNAAKSGLRCGGHRGWKRRELPEPPACQPGTGLHPGLQHDIFDPNYLYISNTAGTNFIPISQTPLINKPSMLTMETLPSSSGQTR